MAHPKRRATYEDLVNVPDNLVAEIIDGELFTSPRPASPHTVTASVLGSDVLGRFHGPPGAPTNPGGWWILYEPELHFADDVLVPDLAGWRQARMPRIPNTAAFTLAPDWVCEVVSPSTGRLDRVRKLPVYGREGVAHAWIVDPLARTVEVFRLDGGRWMLDATHGGDGVAQISPFEAVDLTLGRWWIEL